jgi:hypothetical protein
MTEQMLEYQANITPVYNVIILSFSFSHAKNLLGSTVFAKKPDTYVIEQNAKMSCIFKIKQKL